MKKKNEKNKKNKKNEKNEKNKQNKKKTTENPEEKKQKTKLANHGKRVADRLTNRPTLILTVNELTTSVRASKIDFQLRPLICRSVGPSLGPSVCPSVRGNESKSGKTSVLDVFFCVSVWE